MDSFILGKRTLLCNHTDAVGAEDPVGVRLLGEDSSRGKGELELLDFGTWTRLCSGSLGPIEGQLACRELGFPLLQRIGTVVELVSIYFP